MDADAFDLRCSFASLVATRFIGLFAAGHENQTCEVFKGFIYRRFLMFLFLGGVEV